MAVIGDDELPLRVEGEPVGAELSAGWCGAGVVARRPHVDGEPFALLPLVDRVPRDVAEQQVAAGVTPDRAFRPVESFGERLDLRIARHERVERGIEPLDPASGGGRDRRGLRRLLRERRRRCENESERCERDGTGHETLRWRGRREAAGRLRRETGDAVREVNRGEVVIPSVQGVRLVDPINHSDPLKDIRTRALSTHISSTDPGPASATAAARRAHAVRPRWRERQ